MFEISFSNVMYSKKDKHSIGVWLVDWLDYCKFIVCADVKTYPRLKKDSNSKTYRIIYTHQEALRNECRIREEWNRKSTLTEQRNRQSDCDCGFDLDQSTVDIYALHIYDMMVESTCLPCFQQFPFFTNEQLKRSLTFK